MSGNSLTAADLRTYGRDLPVPCRVALADGSSVVVSRWLRVLPAKRCTGLATSGDRTVVAKFFIAERGGERHWLNECTGLQILHERKVLAPQTIFSGKLAGGGYVVLTQYLPEASSAEATMAPLLAYAFAALGQMHSKGVIQLDAHLDNFLRRGEQSYVIDGAGVRIARSAEEALENLAVLFAQLPLTNLGEEKGLLLDAYESSYGRPIDKKNLDAKIHRVHRQRLSDFLGKCVRDCSLFSVTSNSNRFIAQLRTHLEVLSPLVANPDTWLQDGKALKLGGTATVALVEHEGRKFVIKRYNIKSLGHALSRAWRPSRAWHSWIAGHRMSFLGIATPRPLALIEQRYGALRGTSWLITEFAQGHSITSSLEPNETPDNATLSAVRRLFHELSLGQLSHGDMKGNNLLLYQKRIALIDLDAVRAHRSGYAFRHGQARDIARFLKNWPSGSEPRLAFEAALKSIVA